MSNGLTKAERTTTINYDDEGDDAIITTYSKTLINNLRKNSSATEVRQYPLGGVEFRIPKKLINVRNARAGSTRTLTPEQREAAGERLRNARQLRGRRAGLLRW